MEDARGVNALHMQLYDVIERSIYISYRGDNFFIR